MRYLYVVAVLAAALVTALAVTGTAFGDVDKVKKLKTTLTGAEEVPPADPDGSGNVTFKIDAKMRSVCWNYSVANIGTPTAAHIHKAPAGMNGGVVIATPPDGDNEWKGCTEADKALLKDILKNPTQYYSNVHNAEFPGGAIRGQLGD